MAYVNNFGDNVSQGNFFEKVVLKRINDFFLGTTVYIPYDSNNTVACEIQRRGIDGYIKIYKPKLDIKTRLDHRFYRQNKIDTERYREVGIRVSSSIGNFEEEV